MVAFIMVIPAGLSSMVPFLAKFVYRWGLYGIYAVILFMFVFKILHRKGISKTFLYFILFTIATVFILFLKGHGIRAWLSSFSICLFTALFAEANYDRLDRIILCFLIILEFWIYTNFVLMLLIPEGMYYAESNNSYANWILGYKSSLQYYVLPALCFSWLNMKYRNQRVRYFLLLAVSWASTIIVRNSMLLVGLLAFTGLQFTNVSKIKRLANIWTYYGIDLATNAIFVFFLPWFTNTELGKKSFAFLGKGSSVSSRASIIWPMTLEYIKKSPWFGNGIYSTTLRPSLYRNYPAFIHAHNQLMEIIFIGGVFLFIIYALLHIHIAKSLIKHTDHGASEILSVSIFVLYFMMVVEVFISNAAGPIWLILYLGGACNSLHASFLKRKDCTFNDYDFDIMKR